MRKMTLALMCLLLAACSAKNPTGSVTPPPEGTVAQHSLPPQAGALFRPLTLGAENKLPGGASATCKTNLLASCTISGLPEGSSSETTDHAIVVSQGESRYTVRPTTNIHGKWGIEVRSLDQQNPFPTKSQGIFRRWAPDESAHALPEGISVTVNDDELQFNTAVAEPGVTVKKVPTAPGTWRIDKAGQGIRALVRLALDSEGRQFLEVLPA